ncbi:MAG: hypothetical protein JO114_22075 [Planctomycetaceae bacterium]|nr:hypothetical protein [Planctomycetaceae bacterium]
MSPELARRPIKTKCLAQPVFDLLARFRAMYPTPVSNSAAVAESTSEEGSGIAPAGW